MNTLNPYKAATLLVAVVGLVVGLGIIPAQAHCKKDIEGVVHFDCGAESRITREYDVTVSGDLEIVAGTPDPLGGGRDSGNETVGWNHPGPDIDLSFFSDKFGGNGEGDSCFLMCARDHSDDFLVVTQENDGTAMVQYFFNACGSDEVTEVPYQLVVMFGDFIGPGSWLPELGDKPTNTARFEGLDMWEMRGAQVT